MSFLLEKNILYFTENVDNIIEIVEDIAELSMKILKIGTLQMLMENILLAL